MLYSIARHRFPVPLFGFHFDMSYEELFYEFKFLVYFFNSMYQHKISHIFQNLIECKIFNKSMPARCKDKQDQHVH